MFVFRAFKATNDPELCRRFLDGHVQVLKDYGITNITTNNDQWMRNESVYCIVAEKDGVIHGGIRVHMVNHKDPLPVETAIGDMDPRIHEIILEEAPKGAGELCGLWNSKAVAGLGISILLVRAGISIVNQFDLTILFTICADYTMPMVKKVGFVVERSIGDDGSFFYPNPNYIAKVLRRINAITLETAEPFDRDRIINLREKPEQLTTEIGKKEQKIEVKYELIIPNIQQK